MLSGRRSKRRSKGRASPNAPSASTSSASGVHTKNRVEPGRYSHRKTALPRSEANRKSGFPNENGSAAPPPSGSTVTCPSASETAPAASP
jgi:hypothetical protein